MRIPAPVLAMVFGCSGVETPQDPANRPDSQIVAKDDQPFTIKWDTNTVERKGSGNAYPSLMTGTDCSDSFRMRFFDGEDDVSELLFPGPFTGALSVGPTLQSRIDVDSTPHHWRTDAGNQGVFGGVVELSEYSEHRIAVTFRDTSLCDMDVFGRVDPFDAVSYEELTSGCVPMDEVVLEAERASPEGFEGVNDEVRVFSGHLPSRAWTDEAGDALCR